MSTSIRGSPTASVKRSSRASLMQLGLYVAVNDMERAVAFYRAVFGVEPIQQTDRYSAFSIGGVPFGLFDGGSYAHPLAVGNNCVPNVQVDDIDAEYARIRPLASKITDGIQQAGPFRLFMFADPDGNVLEFFSGS